MNPFKVLTALLAGLLLAVSIPAGAVEHSHGAGGGSACQGAGALPSLDCGLAPSATFDQRGRLWLAWAFGGHVYVNYSDDRGGRFSEPVAVNSVPENISARGENRPKIAVDGRGGIHLSWTRALSKRFSGDIRYSYSDDGGRHFSEPETVNDNRQLIGHRFDALAVSTEGEVFIAWLDKRDRYRETAEGRPYAGAALYYSYKVAPDQPFNANRKIADHTCECCRVAIDLDRALPVLIWRHIYGDNIRDHALVRFTEAEAFSEPQRASHDQWQIEACPHHGPALSVGQTGRLHRVWFNDAERSRGLFYAYSDPGDRSLAWQRPVGDLGRQAGHADVLAVGREVYLVWQEFDGRKTQIRLMVSADRGETWSPPRTLGATAEEADYPFLLQHRGDLFVSWHTRAEGYRLIPVSQEVSHVH